MIKSKASAMMTGTLLLAVLTASPLAMAGKQDGHHQGYHGKQPSAEMCEQMREGKGRFHHEGFRKEMEKYHAEMADRLDLSEEQREIWNDIHEERREKRAEKMEKWHEKMQKRCERMEKQSS